VTCGYICGSKIDLFSVVILLDTFVMWSIMSVAQSVNVLVPVCCIAVLHLKNRFPFVVAVVIMVWIQCRCLAVVAASVLACDTALSITVAAGRCNSSPVQCKSQHIRSDLIDDLNADVVKSGACICPGLSVSSCLMVLSI